MSTDPVSIDYDLHRTAMTTGMQPPTILSFVGCEPSGKTGATLASPPRSKNYLGWPDGRWWLMAVLAFVITAYAVNFIFGTPPGDPIVKNRMMGSWYGWSHVVGGLVSMCIGPFQFLKGLRRQKPLVHRWTGRIYVAAIIASGISGFWVSFNCLALPIGQYLFALLALVWLVTVGMGVSAIWQGDVARHREWMTRNYSLTYAAVMLRWQLPLFITLGMPSDLALTVTGLTSWVPNLVFAEWWLKRPSPILIPG